MNQKIFHRLAWKDARTVLPLAIAILAAIVVFNLLLLYLFTTSDLGRSPSERHWFTFSVWVLLPNLFALGAPAMLIGGEEESGSLQWLRTLPADWKGIAGTKFLIALSGFLVMFGLATVCYLFHRSIVPEHLVQAMKTSGNYVEANWIHVVGQLLFGIVLLHVSFILAFQFRSPVTSLVAVAPVMIGFSYAFAQITDALTKSGYGTNPWDFLFHSHPVLLLAVGITFFAMLSSLLSWSSQRRLASYDRSPDVKAATEATMDAFRPPSQPKMIGTWYDEVARPTQAVAMTWQTLRQNGLVLIAAVVACAEGVIIGRGSGFTGLSGFLIFASGLLVIGGVTFYGDSIRRRVAFYHDRGVKPSLIWISRVAPTLIVMVAVIATLTILEPELQDQMPSVLGVLLAAYGVTQLTSLWAPRPIMVFFLAPALVCLAGAMLIPLLNSGYGSVFSIWFSFGLLLFASWRLMPAWLSGQTDRWFHARFVGYLSLAMVLPYIVMFVGQWVTLPREDAAWRQQMLAINTAPSTTESKWEISDGVYRRSWTPNEVFLRDSKELDPKDDLSARIRKELAAEETIAKHVWFDELLLHMAFYPDGMEPGGYTSESYLNSDLDSAEILAKWSKAIREEAIEKPLSFEQLALSAGQADAFALRILLSHLRDNGPSERIRKIYEMLPDRDLVLQSRRQALIGSWQEYRSNGKSMSDLNQLVFGFHSMSNRTPGPDLPSQWWLGLAREKIRREFDQHVKAWLQLWQPEVSAPQMAMGVDWLLQTGLSERSNSSLLHGNDELRRALDQKMQ